MKKIDFNPLKINYTGTFDNPIHINKNPAAKINTIGFLAKKRLIIYISVPKSLTLGSSLCITESVG